MTSFMVMSYCMFTDLYNAYMTTLLLLDPGRFEVLISHDKMGLHLLQRIVGDDVDAQLLLALGEVQPQLAPGGVARPLAEEAGHLRAAVAAGQRGLVGVVRRRHVCSLLKKTLG